MERIAYTTRRTALALAVAVACLFGLMLGTAGPAAAVPAEYPYWVQGIQVTSENASDVLGDGTVSFAFDHAKETTTLTLNGANIDVVEAPEGSLSPFDPMGSASGLIAGDDLTIVLEGENTISNKADLSASHVTGISAEGALHITGEGSLAINLNITNNPSSSGMGESTYIYGIATSIMDTMPGMGSFAPTVIIDEGAAVSISVKSASTDLATGCLGIVAHYGLLVEDATLEIETGDAKEMCIGVGGYDDYVICGDAVVEIDTGAVTGPATYNLRNVGIESMEGTIEITDAATVTITLGNSAGGNSAISATSVILSEAGTLHAFAGEGTSSYGVEITDDMGETDPTDPNAPISVSGIAILEACGHTRALSEDPDTSHHAIGGAFVSWYYEHDDATVWKESLGPLGGSSSNFQYVRVPRPGTIMRIAGDEANQTAAAIAAETMDSSEWIVLAREDDFADALGATGLAGTLECPIVLTNRESLSPAAADEIKALGATKCYIIGGTGAMKEQLEDDLAGIGVTTVERLWGENSYDTSLACAKEIVELGGNNDNAVIAMSMNFQDALSISPIAYKFKLPVILQTWGDTSADRGFTNEAAAWLEGKALTVVGGPGAISDESIAGYNLYVRIYGESGYDTSNEIAKWATQEDYLDPVYAVIACGAQAPKGVDALAGAALAGKLGCPILLVNGNEAMEAADTTTIDGFLADNDNFVYSVYVLGGTYVVPPELFDYIAEVSCTIES